MCHKIVFFNHKGGVSKTTTAFNVGWMLANMNKKVLLVDADPQCNLTAYFLGDEFDKYYEEDSTKYHNIKDGVKPAFEGKPYPIQAVQCPNNIRNQNLYLLPGHQNLSEYDASLSLAQTTNNAISAFQNLPGAFNELINQTSQKYSIEYVIIDLNPSFSAINQNLFLLSDFFIIPTAPDSFSVMAIETLSNVIPRWAKWLNNTREFYAEAAYPLPSSVPKFMGIMVQRFNIRNGKAAKPYRDNIDTIRQIVQSKLVPALKTVNMVLAENIYHDNNITTNGYCIDEIPDFQGILPKAARLNIPVFEIKDEEFDEVGAVLDQMKVKRDTFYKQFSEICKKIIQITEYAGSTHTV